VSRLERISLGDYVTRVLYELVFVIVMIEKIVAKSSRMIKNMLAFSESCLLHPSKEGCTVLYDKPEVIETWMNIGLVRTLLSCTSIFD